MGGGDHGPRDRAQGYEAAERVTEGLRLQIEGGLGGGAPGVRIAAGREVYARRLQHDRIRRRQQLKVENSGTYVFG